MVVRKLVIGLGFACAAIAAPCLVSAQSAITDAEAIRILDIAGGQRMRSERVVKSACLAVATINFGANFDDIREAYDEFKTAHYGILNGSDTLGIRASTFEDVNRELSVVSKDLTVFAPYVDNMMNTGFLSATDLNRLNESGLAVLESMTHTTDTIARVYAESLDSITVGETITLSIAGRQQMLSQKLVKEMCLMHVNGAPSLSVRDTIMLFDASLSALVSGFPGAGIIAPPNQTVANKLAEAKTIWANLKPIADLAATGEIPDADSLYMFSIAMEAALRTMTEAVDAYN